METDRNEQAPPLLPSLASLRILAMAVQSAVLIFALDRPCTLSSCLVSTIYGVKRNLHRNLNLNTNATVNTNRNANAYGNVNVNVNININMNTKTNTGPFILLYRLEQFIPSSLVHTKQRTLVARLVEPTLNPTPTPEPEPKPKPIPLSSN
mmetsp:Transcript_13941/g.23794  ORF Transcript_13941/g.23794 Transcript_13941/m.23794 type:complete len:151 (+) Transcript_13941:2700-3152(+)